jgi:hypothetical protein
MSDRKRVESQASLIARLGAYSQHAQHDVRKTTAAGRKAFLARFETQVDPEGTLPPEERARRALAARKAYFTQLALLSAQKRRKG